MERGCLLCYNGFNKNLGMIMTKLKLENGLVVEPQCGVSAKKDLYIDHLSKPCKNIDYLNGINQLFENTAI
jgi:hypothetical protein